METYIKIKNNEYPATIIGKIIDSIWNNRSTKTIHLTMNINDALTIFTNDEPWSIITKEVIAVPEVDTEGSLILDDNEQPIINTVTNSEEFDNSEYCIAGPITDYRDGTLDIKMGKYTNEEILLMEVLS